jgi:hypothetical protein
MTMTITMMMMMMMMMIMMMAVGILQRNVQPTALKHSAFVKGYPNYRFSKWQYSIQSSAALH